MKLSVLPVSYFKDIISGDKLIGEWAREGASLGLDAIDISILLLTRRDLHFLSEFRKQVEKEGINICGASTYPDFTHPDPGVRKTQKLQMAEDIRALAAVGTSVIRITAGQAHPETPRTEGIKWAVDGIRSSIPIAEQCGIRLVFENHSKPGVWQYPDFDFPSDIFHAIASELADTPVGIQFDMANPLAFGDDPLEVLEPVLDRVAVVHASDTEVRGALRPVVIGTGIVPYVEIFSRLKKAGYNGWISIEEASGTGACGVKSAVDFVKSTWAAV